MLRNLSKIVFKGNYDLIITEIQRMLGMSEFQSEYLRLELELAKVCLINLFREF